MTIRFCPQAFFALFLCLSAAGCGSGHNNSEASETAVDIENYTVTGSYRSPPLVGNQVIDSSQNNGAFTQDWNTYANAGDRYGVRAFVSKQAFPDGTEIEYFRTQCGASSSICGSSGHLDCTFTSSNRIACNGSNAVDLTNWLGTLPVTGYLILGTYKDGTEVSGVSFKVEFR